MRIPRNNKHQSQQRDQHGFTLFEVLLYIALFSLIIGAILALASITSLQRVKSQAIAEVDYQGESSIALISQTIRGASSISAPLPTFSSTQLDLTMSNSSINPTIFDSASNGSTTSLRIGEGSPAVDNFLTNSYISLSNLSFTNEGLPSTKGSILFQFELTYKSGSSQAEFNYSKTFYGKLPYHEVF